MTEKLKGNNFPNLRFPGFVKEWEVKKLGEIMDFKVTNSFSRENLNYETGTIKNIHYGDIHTKFQTLFDLEKENVPYINEEISLTRIPEDFYCQEGDIVFADASEDLNDVGKSIEIVNINNEKLLAGLHTLLARPKGNFFYRGFNGYLFKSNSVRNQIQKEAQGSKVLSINVGRICNVKLFFPSIQEQQKIASLFLLIDVRIESQKKIIEGLKVLKAQTRNEVFAQIIRESNEQLLVKDILNYEQPTKYIVSSSEYSSDKKLVPVLTANKAFVLGFTEENFGVYDKGNCIILDDFTMDLKYVDFRFKVKSSAIKILTSKEGVNLKFIYEYFSFLNFSSVEHKRHYISEIENKFITLPTIKIQNKTADYLSLLDDKIRVELKIQDLFIQQKKFLLANLFI